MPHAVTGRMFLAEKASVIKGPTVVPRRRRQSSCNEVGTHLPAARRVRAGEPIHDDFDITIKSEASVNVRALHPCVRP